ncbi:uncharacterized protein EMH_0015680 [Eimeria mitis]|uniref:Uncharacterized protein n=1 Tax=Eimeria mitis TaxID=44415 RepID=U6KAW8_9EIME|nr:uncharacterized protein EMH_0015680 [Eimeria mitis]CDJ33342.1 hypothetical protein, conserved [Eimeria mitis]
MSKSLSSPCTLDSAGDPAPMKSPKADDGQDATPPADLGLGVNAVEEQQLANVRTEQSFAPFEGGRPMQPEITWLETNQQQLTKATRTAEELQYLLEEERARNAEMRMQYERQLKLIRNGIQKEKRDLKQTLVQQVDFIVRKYRNLATEAVETARQERQRVQTERIKARELAETACRNFEKDLKERTRKALEEYRQLAQEAHKAAQAEREELRTKWQEAEKRIQCYRLSHQSMKEQLERERRQFGQMMSEVAQRVEKECSEYDTAMLKAVAVFCKTKGVDVDESTLRQQLGDIRIQRLKEAGQDPKVEKECSEYDTAMLKAVAVFCKTKGVDVDESTLRQQLGDIRIQRLKEAGQDPKQQNQRPLTVKYGFQAITPGSS